MKIFIIALIALLISSCSGKGRNSADWDFDCSENRVKIEINRRRSNFLFTTTGLSTAATAQYYVTTCVTTVTSLGAEGIFSIVSAPFFREEIARGGGEHLQAWFQMINIPPENQRPTVLQLKEKYSTLDPHNDLKFVQQIHTIAYDFNQIPLQKRVFIKAALISG
ncbi:MAG: hypothetical protein HQM13_19130 [SAR324 cluster bacterium]|nr:hypothetical protein [SAR324 cluster bacterium]